MNAADLLALYRDSHFKDRDYVQSARIATPSEQARAMAEYLADPASAIKANVEQSRDDVEATAARMQDAKLDGLLDRDQYGAANKDQKTEWRAAIKRLKGDHERAIAELAHWREYLGLAMKGELPLPKLRGEFKDVARELADAKSDPRLPPEPEDAEIPF